MTIELGSRQLEMGKLLLRIEGIIQECARILADEKADANARRDAKWALASAKDILSDMSRRLNTENKS